MIAILTKDDFDLFSDNLGSTLLSYTKQNFENFEKDDVILFKHKNTQIVLKSAHETYREAFYRNLKDDWLEIFNEN